MNGLIGGLFNKVTSMKNKAEKRLFNNVMNIISKGAWGNGSLSSYSEDNNESLMQVTEKRTRGFAKMMDYGIRHPLAMPVMMATQPYVWCFDRLLNIDEDFIIESYEKIQNGELSSDDIIDFLTNIDYECVVPAQYQEYVHASRCLVEKMVNGQLTKEDVYEYCEMANQFKYELWNINRQAMNLSTDEEYDYSGYDEENEEY